MDQKSLEAGVKYELLIMRSLQLRRPNSSCGADRRHYYLLYYIRNGCDLRGTGYSQQFTIIKRNLELAFAMFLSFELHPHERLRLMNLSDELEDTVEEDGLFVVMEKALDITSRIHEEISSKRKGIHP
jgi:hypothetical protein